MRDLIRDDRKITTWIDDLPLEDQGRVEAMYDYLGRISSASSMRSFLTMLFGISGVIIGLIGASEMITGWAAKITLGFIGLVLYLGSNPFFEEFYKPEQSEALSELEDRLKRPQYRDLIPEIKQHDELTGLRLELMAERVNKPHEEG